MGHVAVLGAGPAGCALAIRLRALGHAVTLVDHGRRRPRGAESLSQGAWPLLQALGVGDVMAAEGFPQAARVRVAWGAPAIIRTDPGARAHLLDRGRFDALLQQAARAAGATLHAPASCTAVRRQGSGWQLTTSAGPIAADAFALATGRAGAGPAWAGAPRTLALHARITGCPDADPAIVALADGWLWQLPRADGSAELLAGIAPADTRGRDPAALLNSLRCAAGRTCGAIAGTVGRIDASPRRHRTPIAPGLIRLGDAALALDPLAASGIQKALKEGLAAASVLHTWLARPADTAAATVWWANMVEGTARRHAAWSQGHAAAPAAALASPFWQARAGAGLPPVDLPAADPASLATRKLALSPAAAIVAAPVMEGDFVCRRPAVVHPGLDGPIAFVGGADLAALLPTVRTGETALMLARRWSAAMPLPRAVATARWMVERGLLVAA